MDGKKVTITYTDEFNLWQMVAEGFPNHLPLRNLQWKSANRPVRTIHTLGIELKRLTTETNEKQHMMPVSLLEKPYLNLYFVNCDDNETYRQTVRKQIRDWHTTVSSKKNQEWLIVYVTKHDTIRNAAAKYFNMKGTVFDKIKADFNTSRRDRCVQLRLSDNDTEDLEAWQEFIAKLKEGILSSFDQHVIQYEDDIRRMDAQRTKPGWNYLLAQSFEIMNLYEDALLQYDELEASFFQVLRDRALAWFGRFGGTEPCDDSADILDVKKKPYRDLIMQNTISVFDFRSYLFARQCQLLGRLHRPVEICQRAQLFISSFARSIQNSKENIGEHFLESWIFSSCLTVVNECEELAVASLRDTDEAFLNEFNTAKSGLLDLARKQLDKLGIFYEHLPSDIPFVTALSHFPTQSSNLIEGEPKKKSSITNPLLLSALDSAEAFDHLYLSQTNKALRAYEGSTRTRSLLRLQGDVAALQFHRKKYEDAAVLMENLPTRYAEHVSCVTLLKNHLLLTEAQCKFYGEELKTISGTLDKEVARTFRPIFAATIVSFVDNITEDEPYLKVELNNNLPTAFTFDELTVRLVRGQSGHNDEIWFSTKNEELNPGVNTYHLYSDTTACGSYVADNCRLSIGKVIFTHSFLNDGKKKSFRVNDHPAILRAQVIAPTEIHIGEQQYFIARIFTGHHNIDEGTLLLKPISEGLSFPSHATYNAIFKSISDDGSISDENIREEELVLNEQGISLPFCQSNQQIMLKIPYDCNWGAIEHKVKVSVEYFSQGKTRIFSSVDTVKVWLPLAVTEFHIFRDDCLFLKMDISLNGLLPVRILSTSLLPSRMYNVVDNAAETDSIMTLFPKQHASFVYKLSRIQGNEQEDHTKLTSTQLHFIVKYRTLKDEIEHFIKHTLDKILKSKNLLQHSTSVTENINDHLMENLDYHWYGMSDFLELGSFDPVLCHKLFNNHGDVKEELVNIVSEFWKEYKEIHQEEVTKVAKEFKSEISFPIDVPLSKVLNTVELIITKSNQLIVGEPCHCYLIIQQSSYWNLNTTADTKNVSLEFFYDVHVDFDNWLLSGHKKLCFSSKVGEIKKFFITLVPLKTGHLLVPTIRISSLSSNIFSETVYINNAQQVLVRPRTQSATFFIEQQHRIHSINSGVGFGGPGHHTSPSGYEDVDVNS
ncbi:hypothetical protein G9A89_022673 [Geosiphon pyriformis]|nr:hypothetical protein G9A89_022673 [Geosiphon pyriformis]